MKLPLPSVIIILTIYIVTSSNCFPQEDKLDFTASWKTDSLKNVISITITKGNLPVVCYIYDSSPFTGGRLIKQVANIVKNEFDIELKEKAKVYICIYKNENNLAAKWLQVNKQINR